MQEEELDRGSSSDDGEQRGEGTLNPALLSQIEKELQSREVLLLECAKGLEAQVRLQTACLSACRLIVSRCQTFTTSKKSHTGSLLFLHHSRLRP